MEASRAQLACEQCSATQHALQGKACAPDKPPPAGRLQAILDTILGNLQVRVSNVHIRYEVCPLHLALM